MKWMALCIFGGLGFAMLIAGLGWGARRYELFKKGLRAEGKVVDHYKSVTTSAEQERTHTGPSISYYPVVEFRTADGATVRFHGSTGGDVPDYEKGTVVQVAYDPRNPQGAQIVDFTQFWLGPLVIGVMGLVFFLMGVGAFFLIGGSDRSMAKAQHDMQRHFLSMRPDAIRIEGRIKEMRPTPEGKTVCVCTGRRDASSPEEEFESDTFDFDPGPGFGGRPVAIYLDPFDRKNYTVELGPLLKEILSKRRP